MFATSSAAGGLKMTVHGLVYDMTVKAAKEAALGAGAVIRQVTSGRIKRTDLNKIKEINPNIILIAGGVDYGERDTAIYNAEMIASMNLGIPVIYAGNIENQDEVRLIFEDTNYRLYITENVYPKIDLLNIEPTRRIIQSVFEEHITIAPGMKYIKEMVNENITPTPGAVMEASKLLYKNIGDLLTLDVGGATTDVHSVTDGSDYINKILVNPEPTAKRSVEGDLGVYVNMKNIVEVIGKENLQSELSIDIDTVIENYPPIPKSKEEILFVERLTKEAVVKAMLRHSGKIRNIYGTTGKVKIAEGKDLTEVRYIVGTGGALTRLPSRIEILYNMFKYNKNNELLFPKEKTKILIDNDYIMASMGVLSKKYEEASLKLLLKSLNFEEERLCILG
ncbi:hypothetical protein QCW_0472 [Clostridioides difficile CD69]|nr:hypothetical protein QCW_0472 [Clostridioides difficile CD69]